MLSLDATVHILWLGTPVAACVSGITVLTALSVDSWLKSEEKILNPSYRNGSSKVEFLSKWTTSGLFTLCATDIGRSEFHCQKIDYFPTEEYSPDPNDSTMAIPYTVLKSVGFFLTAVILLTAAEVLCASGHCCNRRRFFTFLSGITFIVSGLFMMLGMVIYIATLKGEVAEKLRPRSTFQPPLFSYTYGWSCYLIMLGFVATEVSGISAIFLYIYWHKRDWHKKDEERYNSQLLEVTPPPCLKHSRPRSLSFHSSIDTDALETPTVRRVRSQQYLDQCPQEQPLITHPVNHISHNHITHHNHNHVSHFNHHHNHQQPPSSLQKQASNSNHNFGDIENFHNPHPQKHRPHQQHSALHHQQHQPQQHQPQNHHHQSHQKRYQYHQYSNPAPSSSHHSVHWEADSFENPPKSGRSLTNLNKNDYRDENFLSRSDTLPRSYSRENAEGFRGGGTLPRSFPRSCDQVYDSNSREEGGSLHKIYSKDDTALCSSLQRKGYSYSAGTNLQYNYRNGNTACSGQGATCSMGAGCCTCCTCYCCCCCWQEGNSRDVRTNYVYHSSMQHHDQASAGLSQKCPQWQGKYYFDRTPIIPRDLTCNTVCTTVDLNSSSSSLQHHQYPQHQPQHHHQHQNMYPEMADLRYGAQIEVPHSSYQQDTQRHTTPV